MSKTSRHSRPNPKNYSEGTPARMPDRKEQQERRRATVSRARKFGATLAAISGVWLVGHQISEMDNAHKQDVAEESAEKAVNAGNVLGVDVNTNVYLREGVAVRTEPKIIRRTEEDRGNELTTVGKGEVLVISNPVNIENEDGDSFMAFTLNDGRTGYVSKDVIGQENPDGERYVIIAPEQQPTLPSELTGDVAFDSETAAFTMGDYAVGTAQIMSPEEALEHMA